MNKQNFAKLVILITCYCSACSSNVDEELARSREATQQLGSQLKNKLVSTLQSSGPETAISVCSLDAITISTEVSNKIKLEVGRTALKIRNPANQPDAWELKQLHWFESQKDAGIEIGSLETYEVTNVDNKKVFRYMKAIPMQEPCALCHGTTLTLPIDEKIKSLYPQDQATGFELGEIRGAFTVKVAL